MIARSTAAAVVIALTVLLASAAGCAAGFDLGCEMISLGVAGTFDKVPAALGGASDAILTMLADQGMSPSDLADVEADFDGAIADFSAGLASVPTLLPLPTLGGALELGIPLVVIDEVRFSGGILTTGIIRGIADLAGAEIPNPLLDQDLDLGGEVAHVTADVDVSAWTLSVEAVKRLDVFLAALNLSAGLGYTSVAVTPEITREVPAEWQAGIDAALGALHLDDIRTAALSGHVGARLELGAPFLRLYAEVKLVQPIAEWVGWWDLHVGGLAGSAGVVIRF